MMDISSHALKGSHSSGYLYELNSHEHGYPNELQAGPDRKNHSVRVS